MADGRQRPIADLRVGDRIIGTEKRGHVPPLRDDRGAGALVHREAGATG